MIQQTNKKPLVKLSTVDAACCSRPYPEEMMGTGHNTKTYSSELNLTIILIVI